MIEGGTGDLLVVGDESKTYELTCPTADVTEGEPHVYKQGGKPHTINKGRIDWWGRDPGWTDTIGFRGKQDVEKPHGEWNTVHVVAKGNTIRLRTQRCPRQRSPRRQTAKGRIQIQLKAPKFSSAKSNLNR